MTADDGACLLEQARRQFFVGFGYAFLLTGFINSLQLTVPLFMLQIYDRVLNSRNLDTLAMLVIVAIGGLVVFAVLDFIRARVFATVAAGIVRRLNLPALQAAVAQSLEGADGKAGQAMRDLVEIRSFLGGSAVSVPLDVLWVPAFFIILFLLHPAFALVAFLAGAILMVLSVVSDLLSRRLLSEASDSGAEMAAAVSASLRSAEVIEAMGMLPALAERWRASQRRLLSFLDRGHRNGKAVSAVTKAVRQAIQVATLSVGAILVLDHQATAGAMVAASIIMGRILLPFEQLVDGWRQWVFAAAAWRRVRDLLTRQALRRKGPALPRPAGHLRVDNLVYVPPGADRPVIKGVSFTLEPGEILAIVGPSAAGKSTLARLLVGLFAPSAGGVYLDGHNVYAWERESFGDAVGYLPQNVALLDGTVGENIARMRPADPAAIIAAARAAGVHEMIGRLPFGYATPVGGTGFVLSGGQRQRVGLARALFGDPSFIVLDEPNASLDFEGEQALLRAVAGAKAQGAAVVIIAHRPSVTQVADKILVLKDGRVEQFGPRTDVIKTLVPQESPPQRSVSAGVTSLARRGEQ